MPARLPPELVPFFFRANVGIVLLSREGRVYAGRRRGTSEWQLPQGGIDPDETPREAALRELAEETGLGVDRLAATTSELGEHPVWLGYELPEDRWSSKHGRGQAQRWFYLRFTGDDAELDRAIEGSDEFDAWAWLPLDELIDRVWEVRRPVYRALRDHLPTIPST